MIYAYYRVSTDEQDCENQRSGVLRYCEYKGITIDKETVEEGVSGKISWKKRKIAYVIRQAKEGDTIIVSELSRLSRSMLDCFDIAKVLTEKKVKVYCVKENMQIDDTALGIMVMSVFAFSAQIERERISQRTKEALNRLKSEGKHLGRATGSRNKKHVLDGREEEILRLRDKGLSGPKISKKTHIGLSTIYAFLRETAGAAAE